MATRIEEGLVLLSVIALRDLILARTYGIEKDICVGLTKETTVADAEFNSCIYDLCMSSAKADKCNPSDIKFNLGEAISTIVWLYGEYGDEYGDYFAA